MQTEIRYKVVIGKVVLKNSNNELSEENVIGYMFLYFLSFI